jgi:Tfp pilus assembly protein PilZ
LVVASIGEVSVVARRRDRADHAGMRILVARFRDAAELGVHLRAELPYGGILVPTRLTLTAGALVIVDVRMPGLRDHLLLRGLVAWTQDARRGEQRAAVAVEFLVTEARRRAHLERVARGEDDAPAKRRHRRVPAELRVDWRLPNESRRRISVLDDIGAGGAFLRTHDVVDEGAPIVVELIPPGASTPQQIEGRVAWRATTPGTEGLGIEFRWRDLGGLRRLRELVRRIESQQN